MVAIHATLLKKLGYEISTGKATSSWPAHQDTDRLGRHNVVNSECSVSLSLRSRFTHLLKAALRSEGLQEKLESCTRCIFFAQIP